MIKGFVPSKKVTLMQDCRNGISPIIVFLPDGELNSDTEVYAKYPFGFEEYNGFNLWGRFQNCDKDFKKDIVTELLTLRRIIQILTNTDDDFMLNITDMKPELDEITRKKWFPEEHHIEYIEVD